MNKKDEKYDSYMKMAKVRVNTNISWSRAYNVVLNFLLMFVISQMVGVMWGFVVGAHTGWFAYIVFDDFSFAEWLNMVIASDYFPFIIIAHLLFDALNFAVGIIYLLYWVKSRHDKLGVARRFFLLKMLTKIHFIALLVFMLLSLLFIRDLIPTIDTQFFAYAHVIAIAWIYMVYAGSFGLPLATSNEKCDFDRMEETILIPEDEGHTDEKL